VLLAALEMGDLASPATAGDADIWVDCHEWEAIVTRTRADLRDLDAGAVPARTPAAVRVSASVLLFARGTDKPQP
jgi:hypothetical protein